MMLSMMFKWHGRMFTRCYVSKASLQCVQDDPIKDISQGQESLGFLKSPPTSWEATISTDGSVYHLPGVRGRWVPTLTACLLDPSEPINHAELFVSEAPAWAWSFQQL